MTFSIVYRTSLGAVAGKSTLVVGATGTFGRIVCATVGKAVANRTVGAGIR
jgi:hypothetical protein